MGITTRFNTYILTMQQCIIINLCPLSDPDIEFKHRPNSKLVTTTTKKISQNSTLVNLDYFSATYVVKPFIGIPVTF